MCRVYGVGFRANPKSETPFLPGSRLIRNRISPHSDQQWHCAPIYILLQFRVEGLRFRVLGFWV